MPSRRNRSSRYGKNKKRGGGWFTTNEQDLQAANEILKNSKDPLEINTANAKKAEAEKKIAEAKDAPSSSWTSMFSSAPAPAPAAPVVKSMGGKKKSMKGGRKSKKSKTSKRRRR